MAIGFFHSQSCEYSIPDEVVRVILDNLADEYKALLIDMVNEQIVDGGKRYVKTERLDRTKVRRTDSY